MRVKAKLQKLYAKTESFAQGLGFDAKSVESKMLGRIRPILCRLGLDLNSRIHTYSHFDKAEVKLPPVYATILITNRCTNHCTFCIWHSEDAKNYARDIYNLPLHISFTEFKREVSILREVGIKHIHICSTGDPMLHKDVVRMVDFVRSSGAGVSLMTNFDRHIKRYLPELAKRRFAYIGANIHSGDPVQLEEIQKGLRWEVLFENLRKFGRLCKENNNKVPVYIASIVTKLNYMHTRSLIDACQELDCIDWISLIGLQPMNFNAFTSFNNQIKDDDVEAINFLKGCVSYGKTKGVKVVMPKIFHNVLNRINCRNPWSKIMVNLPNRQIPREKWVGNVTFGGCLAVTQGQYYSLGNLLNTPWEEIWNGAKIQRVRKRILENEFPDERCKECATHFWTEKELRDAC